MLLYNVTHFIFMVVFKFPKTYLLAFISSNSFVYSFIVAHSIFGVVFNEICFSLLPYNLVWVKFKTTSKSDRKIKDNSCL